jgi:uncharacterized protein (TIGR04255 family)
VSVVGERTVYPSPSIVLVAFELRHTETDPLGSEALTSIRAALRDVLPVSRTYEATTIAAQPGASPQVTQETAPQFMSRDRTLAVTFHAGVLRIEVTRYRRYEHIRDLVRRAVTARCEVSDVDSFNRIGLRYIDEIRVPDPNRDGVPWQGWVDDTLLGPVQHGESLRLSAREWQGIVAYASGEHRYLVLRYGPRVGRAVEAAGDLTISHQGEGPFFLLDIDSYWEPVEFIAFSPEVILSETDMLHTPVGELFETLITDRLRMEVLGAS